MPITALQANYPFDYLFENRSENSQWLCAALCLYILWSLGFVSTMRFEKKRNRKIYEKSMRTLSFPNAMNFVCRMRSMYSHIDNIRRTAYATSNWFLDIFRTQLINGLCIRAINATLVSDTHTTPSSPWTQCSVSVWGQRNHVWTDACRQTGDMT